MENEIWKDVIGYEGKYQVSDFGNVKSLERVVTGTSCIPVRIHAERILKPGTDLAGYLYVNLCKDNIRKLNRVHRLVLNSFTPNPENKNQVNHVNGIRNDNKLTNLEWATASENIIHAYKNLPRIKSPCKGSKNGSSKITEQQAIEIISLLPVKSNMELCKMYDLCFSSIRQIRHNESWKHIKR